MNIWQGKKVKLRAVESSDLETYFCKDNEIDTVAQRKGDRLLYPLSKTMMEDRVKALAKNSPQNDDFFLIIEDDEGHAVGNINTHSCSRIDGTFAYGLGIKNEFRGNGYAKEAILLVLRFCFMELGFNKVETRVYSFNHESIGLHKKLGFIMEGTLRKSHFAFGEYCDVIGFGMLKDEFFLKFPEFMNDYV